MPIYYDDLVPAGSEFKPSPFGQNTTPGWADDFVYSAPLSSGLATAITLSGPASGNYGAASTAFTAGANGPVAANTVVTPTDSSGLGSFTPSSVTILSGQSTASSTFTYTPTSAGARNINATNNQGLTAPSNVVYTANAVVPGVPTGISASPGNVSAQVFFTPGNNGGSAITGYTATSTPGSITGTGSSSPITVSGLTNGTAYTFTVHATNAIGNSAESSASSSVTPRTIPGAPTIGTLTRDITNGTITVTFTPPAGDGGAAITSYTAVTSYGSVSVVGAGSPIVLDGVPQGASTTVHVFATNVAGNGPNSAESNSVVPEGARTGGGGFSSRKRLSLPNMVKREDEDEKRERRIREGTLPAPVEAKQVIDRSEKLSKAIERVKSEETKLREESAQLRKKIAQLEAQNKKKEATKVEKQLLVKDQEVQLAKAEEAMLTEQQEVLDVAYVAVMALSDD